MKPRSVLFVVLVCGIPAAFAPRSRAPEPELCNIQFLAEREPAWQLVRAEGFTFCVPGDWSADGKASKSGAAAHSWRTRGASIKWYSGRDAAGSARPKVPFTVTRMDGARGQPNMSAPPPNVQRFSEEIDGRSAALWVIDDRSSFKTGAAWDLPVPVYLVGEANSRALATAQFDIFRSVRFVTE